MSAAQSSLAMRCQSAGTYWLSPMNCNIAYLGQRTCTERNRPNGAVKQGAAAWAFCQVSPATRNQQQAGKLSSP